MDETRSRRKEENVIYWKKGGGGWEGEEMKRGSVREVNIHYEHKNKVTNPNTRKLKCFFFYSTDIVLTVFVFYEFIFNCFLPDPMESDHTT